MVFVPRVHRACHLFDGNYFHAAPISPRHADSEFARLPIGSGVPGGSLKRIRSTTLPLLRLAKTDRSVQVPRSPLRVAGIFAGIGGIERGLHDAGHATEILCEIDAPACAVLEARFPDVPKVRDVRELTEIPRNVDLITAGFPCQDLSQAGKTAGIEGSRSGLVGEVFRLLRRRPVKWVLLENVPFMLQLAKGRALEVIVGELERLGYRWAYRVVNAMSFGLPQRRERVFLLASQDEDPRSVLLSEDAGEPVRALWRRGSSFGFYWTEGTRGLGAAIDCVPTLKGGSTVGIPSPPAILLSNGSLVTPEIRDAERLQGFEPNWTKPAETVARKGVRWKLVGNAVSVRAAKWIGSRLLRPEEYTDTHDVELPLHAPWPKAAWNMGEGRRVSAVSSWPRITKPTVIADFLRYPVSPLSEKATAGFLSRARASTLRFPRGFLDAVEKHLRRMRAAPVRSERDRVASV
jgi:DNA (cytosine-5)-methyltransferase 1